MFDTRGIERIAAMVALLALVAAGAVQAGFLTSSSGEGVKTGYGECWKSAGGDPVAPGCLNDSDADGVPDDRDRCPNTPNGVSVGTEGCPVDINGDGIPDFREVVQ